MTDIPTTGELIALTPAEAAQAWDFIARIYAARGKYAEIDYGEEHVRAKLNDAGITVVLHLHPRTGSEVLAGSLGSADRVIGGTWHVDSRDKCWAFCTLRGILERKHMNRGGGTLRHPHKRMQSKWRYAH